LSEIDIQAVQKSMTEEQLESLGADPEMAILSIAKQLRGQFASMVPPITARSQDAVLTDAEKDEVWRGFVGAKRGSSGKPMFPDANDEGVFSDMQRAYGALPPELLDEADRSRHVLEAVQELTYLKTFRMRHARMAMKQQREAKVAEQNKTNQQGVAVQGSGSETSVKAQTDLNARPQTEEERIRAAILSAEL